MQYNLKIDPQVMSLLKAKTPNCASLTSIANLLLLSALESNDTVITLGRALRPDPSKAVNKEEEERVRAREADLRAEEIHAPAASVPARKPSHDVPEGLKTFEPMIRAYWAAKPKTKTAAAWKLLMRELNKIHDQYGSDVLEEQLLQAEANRWQSITLKNYEEFGVSRAHRPGQSPEPEFKHPAHQVFTAAEQFSKPEWQNSLHTQNEAAAMISEAMF